MKNTLLVLLVAAFLAFPAGAGEQKEELVVKKLVPDAKKSKIEDTLPGKRDPFWDLLKKVEAKKKIAPEDFLIEELTLEGIVKMRSGAFQALLITPKNIPFVAVVGQKFRNGKIVKITLNEVIFKKFSLPLPQ